MDPPGAAHAGRHAVVEHLGKLGLHRLDIRARQAGGECAHPAGDIEAHPARRHHAAIGRIECRDPAYGETITPVGVGHGIGGLDDPRQSGDIGHLLVDLVVHVLDELAAGVDDGGNPHGAACRHLPGELADLFEAGKIHKESFYGLSAMAALIWIK
jgi:hypothetical protein